jgi:Tol biopolymer transport system component
MSSLVWSPGGDTAAFSIAGSTPGEKARLSLFNQQDQTWTTLAEFNYIDPPTWSSDGEWLAFRVQDGEGKDEIYIIRRDGTELTNLSTSGKLPDEGQPYVLHGWISNQVFLRGRNEKTYLMRVEDGKITQSFDSPMEKSVFAPSPDGYFLAYLDATETHIALKLVTPDGKTTRDLASFEHASLYPIVWSPDGTQLAFAKMTNNLSDGEDIYIIDSDGRNLQQVYHGDMAGVYELSFSPDGKYLLFQNDDAAGRHIFSVDLSTLETHLIQVPNIPLDWWWLAPSWQR